MKCPYCGAEINRELPFCTNCGNEWANAKPVPEEAKVQEQGEEVAASVEDAKTNNEVDVMQTESEEVVESEAAVSNDTVQPMPENDEKLENQVPETVAPVENIEETPSKLPDKDKVVEPVAPVVVENSAATLKHRKTIALILTIFLGVWGVQHFYLKNVKYGLVFVVLMVLSPFIPITPAAVCIMWLVDIIRFIRTPYMEFEKFTPIKHN